MPLASQEVTMSDPKNPQTYKSDPATADDAVQQASDEWEKEHGDESKAPEDQSDQSKPDMSGEDK
jgi:hypothetical protein